MQSNQCIKCKHYLGELTCMAFPDKIPQKILTGEIDHDIVVDGQNDRFVYEEE